MHAIGLGSSPYAAYFANLFLYQRYPMKWTDHSSLPKVCSGKKPEEQTIHRVYVEFEDGYFMVLGALDPDFQEMVNDLGRPTKVEFRATDEGWHVEGDGTVWTCVEGS